MQDVLREMPLHILPWPQQAPLPSPADSPSCCPATICPAAVLPGGGEGSHVPEPWRGARG